MGEPDMRTIRAVLKSIFGTDTRCREVERHAADEMLNRVERQMAQLDIAFEERPARNIDEALRQVSRSER
ncbi:MAG: hypothetical protein H0T60_06830 [Acidobacteria bacterium]|nr:hypothetical protein [Acidobacteriota bacterium]